MEGLGRKGNEHRIAVGVMPIAEQAGPSPSADFDISCLQGRPGNTSESNQSHSDSRRVEVLLFGGTHIHEDAFGLPELIAWFRSGKAAPRG